MPKLLQINVSLNYLSTGKIAEGIALVAKSYGWECYTVYSGRYSRASDFPALMVSNRIEEYIHYAMSLFYDAQGLGSINATKRLIKKVKSISPDVVHLHNIHGSFINYEILFHYLQEENIPVVWTMHDCWPFTGHCAYFDRVGCEKWKTLCHACPQKGAYPPALIDGSTRNFLRKKALFGGYKNLTMIPVSSWLGGMVSESFFKGKPIQVIHNGIDLNIFKPSTSEVRNRYMIGDRCMLLGVANGFGERKGLNDFVQLSQMLGTDYQIVLVGASDKEKRNVPQNIIVLGRTEDIQGLVDLYSAADIFLNPTYEDNFPTTNLEALACGTPVITYCTGGSPEAIDATTGVVVEQGNIKALGEAIREMRKILENKVGLYSPTECRKRVETYFDKNKCFEEYVKLYDELINDNRI